MLVSAVARSLGIAKYKVSYAVKSLFDENDLCRIRLSNGSMAVDLTDEQVRVLTLHFAAQKRSEDVEDAKEGEVASSFDAFVMPDVSLAVENAELRGRVVALEVEVRMLREIVSEKDLRIASLEGDKERLLSRASVPFWRRWLPPSQGD